MKQKLRSIAFTLILASATALAAYGQEPARLQFERLDGLETRARDVVEVNVDGKLLELAKRVTSKLKDDNAKKVAVAMTGLKGIYVRVYNFEKENEYNVGDVDQIRAQLQNPGWEKLANVRSKRNNQKVDVYTMFTGEKMDGLAVVLSEAKSVAVVNVIGMIDLEMLVELSGRLNIPKIDITNEDKPKNDKE
jgi:hypothetical protein